jgi:dihydropteroate synthase
MILDPGPSRARHSLTLRGRPVLLGERTWVMGVLNVTPDSFSDGGRFADPGAAVAQGLALFEAGADVVDVGGESTRPGASRVGAAAERERVVPVIQALRDAAGGYVSVDTSKAEVARAALDAGADLVNDVSGLRYDTDMAAVVARAGVPAILMHLRGGFEKMHEMPRYSDVMGEVTAELRSALLRAESAGIAPAQLIVDPGIGFSKSAEHSLEVLRRLPELAALGRPMLVGPSRKSFMARLATDRAFGTAAAVAVSVMAGAHIVRVHDVGAMVDVVRVCDAVRGGRA